MLAKPHSLPLQLACDPSISINSSLQRKLEREGERNQGSTRRRCWMKANGAQWSQCSSPKRQILRMKHLKMLLSISQHLKMLPWKTACLLPRSSAMCNSGECWVYCQFSFGLLCVKCVILIWPKAPLQRAGADTLGCRELSERRTLGAPCHRHVSVSTGSVIQGYHGSWDAY